MKPPICELCNSYKMENGALVYFQRTANDNDWYRLAELEGLVGHPPNAAWFCERHLHAANGMRDLTIDVALRKLKSMDFPEEKKGFFSAVKSFVFGEEE